MEFLAQLPSLSGNIAIDLAILCVMGLSALRVAQRIAHRSTELAAERIRTRQLSSFLQQKEAKVDALRETLMRARERTHANVEPIIQQQHTQAHLADSTSETEHDDRYEELEEQLRSASERRPPGGR